jgi:hypothetical protein
MHKRNRIQRIRRTIITSDRGKNVFPSHCGFRFRFSKYILFVKTVKWDVYIILKQNRIPKSEVNTFSVIDYECLQSEVVGDEVLMYGVDGSVFFKLVLRNPEKLWLFLYHVMVRPCQKTSSSGRQLESILEETEGNKQIVVN